MDTESIKALASILLWGALIFFMMRFGCGAHMMGGHGGHGGHGEHDDAGGPLKDPVCGMDVAPDSAGGAAVHRGKTYYFCSPACRDKFEKAPDQYAGNATRAAGASHGGHHG